MKTSLVRRALHLALAVGLSVTPQGLGFWPPASSLEPRTDVAWAAVPWMINYQGRLTDTGGSAITGSYAMTFRLYDEATAGNEQWEEQQEITLVEADNGIFSVVLGGVTSLSTVDFNVPLWLSVQVADDEEMTPRQRLTATGYAMNADTVDSLDSAKFMRTDVSTSTSGTLTITRSGLALLIQPTVDPAADTKLLDVQNAAGTSKFSVDIEGDMVSAGDVTVVGDLDVTGTITGSTTISGTTNPSWNVGSTTDATSNTLSLLMGQAAGQESLAYQGASTGDFSFSDDVRLSTQSALRLEDDAGGDYVGLKAPAGVTSYTLTLPATVGASDRILKTVDANGTLAWVADDNTGGTVTQIDQGTGLSFSSNPLTTTGTISLDAAADLTYTGVWTLNGDWVNTANPWADNEVANDITLTNLTQITTRSFADLQATCADGEVVGGNAAGTGLECQADTDSGGTVASVGLSMPAEFSVANSPVTGSGTLTVTEANQSANLIYAGPASGAAASPGFRVLGDDDIPDTLTVSAGSVAGGIVGTGIDADNITAGTLNAARLPNDGYASTYVNVTGDTMSGSLTMSNVASDLVTGANEHLALMPNGTGNVGIGTTAPLAKLDVAGSARVTGTATSVLTGSIDPAAATAVVGVGTAFTTELVVGDRITVSGETRTVTAIADNTNLTVDTAFSDNANDASPDKLAAELVVRDSGGNLDAVINDAGSFGLGVIAPDERLHMDGRVHLAQTSAPADTTDRLYNVAGALYWDGIELSVATSNPSFASLSSGENVSAGMTVGTGASIVPNGTGIIRATDLTAASSVVADAEVDDTITLTNLTQVTTRSFADLQATCADGQVVGGNAAGTGLECQSDVNSGGTVTSVDLAVPSEFTLSGNPITTNGTITIAEADQTANTLYAGPSSGAATAPGFRVLVDNDIPDTISIGSTGSVDWASLTNYPSACAAGEYLRAVGDTLTCVSDDDQPDSDAEVPNNITLASTSAASIAPSTDVVPLTLYRGTDAAPVENLLTMRNAADDTTLFAVDKDGSLSAGTIPWGRVSGFTGDTTADTIADDGTITLGTETTGAYDNTADTIADDGAISDAEADNDLTIASTKAGSFKPTTDTTPLVLARGTDTAPVENLLTIRNAADNATLFAVSPAGAITTGTIPLTSVTGQGNLDLDSTDDLTTSTVFAGDVGGAYNNLQLGTGVVGATELGVSGVTAGNYGSATQVGTFTVDEDGRITTAANTTISVGSTNIQNDSLDFDKFENALDVDEDTTITMGANDLTFVGDVTINAPAYNAATPTGGLFIAEDPAAAESSGTIFLGRKSNETSGWSELHYDGTTGVLSWNGAHWVVTGDSPAYMGFTASSDPTKAYSWKFNPDVTPKTLSLVELTNNVETDEYFRFGADGSMWMQDTDGVMREYLATGGRIKSQVKNMLRNASFESPDPGGWEEAGAGGTGFMGIISTPGTFKFGQKAVRVMDDNAVEPEGIKQKIFMPGTTADEFQGQLMTLSVWARRSGVGGAVTASLGFDDGVTVAASRFKDISVTTTYQQFTYTFLVDAAATKLEVKLFGAAAGDSDASQTNNPVEILYDGITLARGPFAMDFGPGVLTDTGEQTIYGDLTIGADKDPNAPGADSTLAFGKPFGIPPGAFDPAAKTLKWIQANNRFEFNQDVFGTGVLSLQEIATPADPAANQLKIYAVDQAGVTRLAYRDSAGAQTILSAQANPNFGQIQTGANTTATMTVDTGASLVPSGSGVIRATAFAGSGSVGDAVDLGTAEVAGDLPLANLTDGANAAHALFATAVGAPAYRAIADGDLPDTLTASNYVLKAGDTMTGPLAFDATGGGETDPSISASANGDMTLAAPTGTVVVGSGSGNISLSLSTPADVLLADKTTALAAPYTANDFTFTRTLTSNDPAESQGGAVLKVTDASDATGTTMNPDMVLVDADPAGGTFTGNLLRLQTGSVDQFVVNGAGSLTVGTVPWARISGFNGDTTPDTIADDNTITLGSETTGAYDNTADTIADDGTIDLATEITGDLPLANLTDGGTATHALFATALGTPAYRAIADTDIPDTITMDWAGLQNYPAACGAGEVVQTVGDTLGCVAVNTDTSITLQDAYNAVSGNTITTTDNRNILISLADTATDSDFLVNILGTGNIFQIQDTGTPLLTVQDRPAANGSGDIIVVAPVLNDMDQAGDLVRVMNIEPDISGVVTNGRVQGLSLNVGISPASSTTAIDVNSTWDVGANFASDVLLSGIADLGIGVMSPGAKLDIDNVDVSNGNATESVYLRSNAQSITLVDGTTRVNQRQNQFLAPTMIGVAGGSPEAVTNAATLYIDNAPITGADMTISNAYALWVDSGLTRLDDAVQLAQISAPASTTDKLYNVAGALYWSGIDLTAATANPSFASLSSGQNLTAGMVVGTGASLSTAGSGTIQATNLIAGSSVVADAEVDDNLTVDWAGLQNYPVACGAGQVVQTVGDTLGCVAVNTDASITLQDAYDAVSGNTITTTDNRNVVLSLADTATDSDFLVNLLGTGNVFEIQDGGLAVLTVSEFGNTVFRNTSDNATAFQILDADAGTPIMLVNSIYERVGISIDLPVTTLDVGGSARVKGSATSVLAGSIDPDGDTSVAGVGTFFLRELAPGDRITVSGETRTVTAITDDTNLTVDTAFSDNAADPAPDKFAAEFIVLDSGSNLDAIVNDLGNFGLGVIAPDEQLHMTGRLHLGQTTAPASTTDKLYNVGGNLIWNGAQVATGSVGVDDSLQTAYDTGATITTADATNIIFSLADTATDSDLIMNMLGTGNVVQVQDAGTPVFTIANEGAATFQTKTDSVTGLQVLDADGGVPVLNIDTVNERVGIGTAAPTVPFEMVIGTGNLAAFIDANAIASGLSVLANSTAIKGEADFGTGAGVYGLTIGGTGVLGVATTSGTGGRFQSLSGLGLDSAGSARVKGTATSVLTGSIDPAAATAVVGVGTAFTTELVVGDRITVTGQTRTVTAITDATNLTVDTAFSDNANDVSPDKLAAELVVLDASNGTDFVVQDRGYVGIGTAAPAFSLDVITADAIMGRFGNGFGSGVMVSTTPLIAGYGEGIAGDGQTISLYSDQGAVSFHTGNPMTEKLRMTLEGNLGLGMTGPSQKLDIDGSVLVGARGSEKATNGVFGGACVNWTLNSGWTCDTVTDEADHTSGGGTNTLTQNVSAVAGETYAVSFRVKNRTTGSVTPSVGGVAGTAVAANTSSDSSTTQVIVATGTGNLIFTPTNDFNGSVDTVSVKQLTGGDLYTMGNVGLGLVSPDEQLHMTGRLHLGQTTAPASTGDKLYNVGGSLYWAGSQLATGGSSPWQTTSNVTNLITGTDNVTVGSAVNLGKLAVDGDADEVQLLVQGNATQTVNNLVVFENSSGADLFRMNGTGEVTVQTTTDSIDAFQVLDADGGVPVLNIDTVNERVGIGTAAPSDYAMLDVVSGASNTAGNYTGAFSVTQGDHTMVGEAGTISIQSNDPQGADRGGSVAFQGRYTGTARATFAKVKGAKENNSDLDLAGYLALGTRPSGGAVTERMRITSTGKVGINTPTPLTTLDVVGATRVKGNAASVLTGSIDPAASTAVVGVGTAFLTELVVGDRITVSGETRTVTAVADNTNLSVNTAFTDNANDISVDRLPAEFVTLDNAGGLNFVVNSNGAFGNLATLSTTNSSEYGIATTAIADTAVASPSAKAGGGLFAASTHTSGTMANLVGALASSTKLGTGAVDTAVGLYAQISNVNATGAITNGYGLYISDSTETGAITNDWGLYQVDAAAWNYFAGNLGVGVTQPDEALHTSGRIHLDPTTAPVTTTGKLYNVGGGLYWDGAQVATGTGFSDTLQTAYDNSSSPATITTASAKNIVFSMADSATDADLLVNLLGPASDITVTSSLANGARAADVMTISQANDATNNSTQSLLELSQLDTASVAAVLNIIQAAGSSGINIQNTSTTGYGMYIETAGTASNRYGLKISTNGGSVDVFEVKSNGVVAAGNGTEDNLSVLDVSYNTTGATADNSKLIRASNAGVTYDTTGGVLTEYGGHFSNVATRAAGANALTNVGLYATASGAQNNYAAVFDAGNVGIGTATPGYKLDVNGTTNISGALTYGVGGQPKRTIVLTAAGAIAGPNSTFADQVRTDGTNFSYYTLNYDAGSDEKAFWQFVVPDAYTGTTVDVTLYWMYSGGNCTAGSCEVVWDVEMDGKAATATFDAALQAAASTTATGGNTGILNATATIAPTTGWAPGEVAIVKVTRNADDAADDLGVDAKLVQVKIEWTAAAESD